MDQKMPANIESLLIKTIKECKGQVDYQGWRFSINVGIDTYQPFETDDEDVKLAFWYGIVFLKTNFIKKGSKETVTSYDLKHAFEKWWTVEYPDEPPIYMSNGIMLLSIIYSKFGPPDELWYSMDLSQNAYIQKNKWDSFCEKYNYIPRNVVIETNPVTPPTI